jgi:hypothetical protein
MANKDIVFDLDALADERVTGDLYVPAYFSVLLNLDECTNFAVVANGATIKIYE